MNAIEKLEYRDHSIEVFIDDDPQNPRECDNIGTIVCFHRRYNLGDKHTFNDMEEFKAWTRKERVVMLPVYMYDHSGIAIKTSPFNDIWDSGLLGYIYVEKKKIEEEYGKLTSKTVEKVKTILNNEILEYDQYIRGDIYRYTIEGPEISESGSGYYSIAACIKDAEDIIDYHLDSKLPLSTWESRAMAL